MSVGCLGVCFRQIRSTQAPGQLEDRGFGQDQRQMRNYLENPLEPREQ